MIAKTALGKMVAVAVAVGSGNCRWQQREKQEEDDEQEMTTVFEIWWMQEVLRYVIPKALQLLTYRMKKRDAAFPPTAACRNATQQNSRGVEHH